MKSSQLLVRAERGEVYRARDPKLGRDVAIKVLPQAFAGDTDRVARFQREAKVLASLDHPNIATIHGLEEAGGTRALVMVVGVSTSPVFQAGTPKLLFQAPQQPGFWVGDYTVDSKRFLFLAPPERTGPAPFTVALNWQAALKK